MKKSVLILSVLLVISFIVLVSLWPILSAALGEESETLTTVLVTAKVLNGRAEPTKKATIEARFDRGDLLTATGEWSKDRKWIEVYGGETGVVWCDARYISERDGEIVVCNLEYKEIKLRKSPIDGKVIGYLKKGKELYIDRVVLGWGHSNRGWVNMNLVYEED